MIENDASPAWNKPPQGWEETCSWDLKKIITINSVNQKETLTVEILFHYHDD